MRKVIALFAVATACAVALGAAFVRAIWPAAAQQPQPQQPPAQQIIITQPEEPRSVFDILRTGVLGFTAVVAVIALLVAVTAVIIEIKEDSITIDTFSVPPAFEEQGYTGRVLALRFIDELEELSRGAERELPRKRVAADWQRQQIDLPVPEMNTNLHAVIGVMRHIFGAEPQTFGCEIANTGTSFRVRARLSDHPSFAREYPADTRVDVIIGDVARHFCAQSQPLVLAAYDCGRADINPAVERRCMSDLQWIIHSARRVDAIWAFNLLGLRQDKTDHNAAVETYSKAINFGCTGDFEDAETACAIVYGNRGSAYRALGDPKKAIADFERARDLRPRDGQLLTNLGVAYEDADDYDRALAAYTEAFKIAPRPLPLVHRGTLKAALDRLDDAIADFNQALRVNPAFAPAYLERARVLRRREKSQEAEMDFQMSLFLQPDLRPKIEEAQGVPAAEMRP